MKKITEKLQRFMMGRYGIDHLNKLLFIVFFIITGASIFFPNIILQSLSLIVMVLLYFRAFSKNIYKRTQENLKYLKFTKKIKNFFKGVKDAPRYKVFKCPTCGQKLRVPRGKGVITITCKKCHTKFDGKS